MKKIFAVILAAVVLVSLVAGAGLAQAPKIGLILATGGLGDRSFNDQSFKGASDAAAVIAAQYGVTVEDVLDYVEPTDISEYEGYQLQFADAGIYDIIVCIGFDQAAALETVAPQYPDQKFVIIDMVVVADNVASVVTNDWEEAFLCGVVAGMMTKTNTVGFEGGMEIPLIISFMNGYTQGAQWANPDVDVWCVTWASGRTQRLARNWHARCTTPVRTSSTARPGNRTLASFLQRKRLKGGTPLEPTSTRRLRLPNMPT